MEKIIVLAHGEHLIDQTFTDPAVISCGGANVVSGCSFEKGVYFRGEPARVVQCNGRKHKNQPAAVFDTSAGNGWHVIGCSFPGINMLELAAQGVIANNGRAPASFLLAMRDAGLGEEFDLRTSRRGAIRNGVTAEEVAREILSDPSVLPSHEGPHLLNAGQDEIQRAEGVRLKVYAPLMYREPPRTTWWGMWPLLAILGAAVGGTVYHSGKAAGWWP
jgi:hypothetical protein